MEKTHIYCVPGLAASSKIFERLKFPENYEVHFLEWMIPESMDETIEHYAQRMCDLIVETNVILIGVSFGGVMVQEMSKIINAKKIILISSVKNAQELPKRLKVTKFTKAYKLFPAKKLSSIESFMNSFGKLTEERMKLYNLYLSERNELYLKWGIHNVLHWKQKETLDNCYHIHGTSDSVFPIKHIKNAFEIKDATHAMVVTKARLINPILEKLLNE